MDLIEAWKQKDIDEPFRDYLAGKRVIVVGPAKSIFGSRQGENIESHDLVVRLNNGVNMLFDKPALQHDVGRRCDVLYHNEKTEENPLHADRLTAVGVKWLATCHNRASILYGNTKNHGALKQHTVPFVKWCKQHAFRLHVPGFGSYERLSAEVGHPNAGVSAIVDLLAHGAAEVATFGMSMFSSGYEESYRRVLAPLNGPDAKAIVARWHDIERQVDYLKRLMVSDSRFNPGSDMKAVFE